MAPATIQRLAEAVDRRVILEIERNERREALAVRPQCADRVVEILERALGAGDGDDMNARGRQRQRDRAAYAARRAGDDGDSGGRPPWPLRSCSFSPRSGR